TISSPMYIQTTHTYTLSLHDALPILVHHVVAEGGAQHPRLAHQRRRLAQRVRNLPYALGVVDVAGNRGLQFQLLLDTGQTRRQEPGTGHVGIQVGTPYAAFDADRLRPLAADAKTGRAVVERPDGLGWREHADNEALVAVDVRREERRDLARIGQLPGDVVLHQRRHSVRVLLVAEGGLACLPQRLVDMARRAGAAVVVFRHERRGAALGMGNFLHA